MRKEKRNRLFGFLNKKNFVPFFGSEKQITEFGWDRKLTFVFKKREEMSRRFPQLEQLRSTSRGDETYSFVPFSSRNR